MLPPELLAVAAAACIAVSGMLAGELRGRVPVMRFTRWNLTTAFLLTAAASLAVGGWRTLTPVEALYLAGSSVCGILIASTTYFWTIFVAGPRITALLFSLTTPLAVALAYVVLGETITARQALGIAAVLAGIMLAIGRPDAGSAQTVPWAGLVLGAMTAMGQATSNLLSRPAMAAGVEPFTAMALRAGLAAAVFQALRLLPASRLNPPYRLVWSHLGVAMTGAFFGTGLGMSLMLAAFAHGSVGVVSALSSMTPVVILPMLWVRSGIAPHPLAWIGAALAVLGTGLISV